LYADAESLEDLYAFQYTANDISVRHVGWDFFDLQSEFLRMGVPNENWVLSHINKDYEVHSLTLPVFTYHFHSALSTAAKYCDDSVCPLT